MSRTHRFTRIPDEVSDRRLEAVNGLCSNLHLDDYTLDNNKQANMIYFLCIALLNDAKTGGRGRGGRIEDDESFAGVRRMDRIRNEHVQGTAEVG